DITVGQLTSSTAVVTSGTPSNPGASVTFTATVSPLVAPGPPTGTVQFKNGPSNLGAPVPLSGGVAALTTSALSAGAHTITAEYSGDAVFLASTGSLSGGQFVRGATTTTLGSSSNPSTIGASVTVAATVATSSGLGTPTGSVTFRDGVTPLATTALSGGTAALTTSALTLGTHHLAVDYPVNSTFAASTGLLDQVVVCQAIAIGPASLPLAIPNVAYPPVTLTQTGAIGSVTFNVTGGALPTGMHVSSAGVLSGTPTVPGPATFTVTVTDSNGCTGTKIYTLTVGCRPITITPGTLPRAAEFTAYQATLSTTGAHLPVTFTLASGSLPNGLSLSAAGVIDGGPDGRGSFTFDVHV